MIAVTQLQRPTELQRSEKLERFAKSNRHAQSNCMNASLMPLRGQALITPTH